MAKKSAAPPPPPPPAELPPPPAGDLFAGLSLDHLPPPPPADLSPEPFEPPADALVPASDLANAHEALSVARAEIDRLSKENADLRTLNERGYAEMAKLQAQAERPARGSQHQPRRNWAFELPNGSRRIVSGVTEREAREKLGADAAEAKFKGCPQ